MPFVDRDMKFLCSTSMLQHDRLRGCGESNAIVVRNFKKDACYNVDNQSNDCRDMSVGLVQRAMFGKNRLPIQYTVSEAN